MPWRKSVLLTVPLVLSGIVAISTPASATTVPIQVPSGIDWTSVSVGGSHLCGLRSGKLYCWGSNDEGQVGNGGDDRQDVPDQIGSSSEWTAVSASAAHTCGIRSGRLYCWGNNENGRLGDGTTTNRPTPKQITTATDWTTVSAGATHTCATRAKLYCWGNNENGQVGNGGSGTNRLTPQQITTATDWKTVSAGASHTCATRGKLYCWGNDSQGQLGNGTAGSATTVVQITTATDWKTVSAGASHTCATRGKLYCWGGNVTYPTPGTAYPANVAGFEDMSYWKLTVPVDSDGGTDGTAVEVRQPDLATFKNPAYFHASSDNQKVYFRARVDGATTSGSDYPRSELREMESDGVTNAGWSNASVAHRMTITQAITHLPDAKPHVVAGQIHGGSSDVLQIRLEGTNLFARFEGDSRFDQTLNANYQLGTIFTVAINADSAGIAVDYNDVKGVSKQVSRRVVASAATWYFKAGCYTQSNDSVSNERDDAYGEVLIDSVAVTPVT